MLGRRRVGEKTADVEDVTDAVAAIDQFRHWIANADTKAGFLVAAITVLVGAISGQSDAARMQFPPTGLVDWIGIVLLGSSLVVALAAALLAASVLMPKVKQTVFSRYSWPAVAQAEVDFLVGLSADSQRREAWVTAKALAEVAESKYKLLRYGIATFILSALLLVLALLALGG